MVYKKLIPCIFISQGKAVKWFDNSEVLSEDVVGLAKAYDDAGADQLIVFDLSSSDVEHDNAIDLIKKMNRTIRIPMIAGGNIRRQEDVKKILYAGAKKAILNLSKSTGVELIEEVSKRFGKDKIAVSLNDFDRLYKSRHLITEFASEIIFMHRPDLDSVTNTTNLPTVILTDVLEEKEVLRILKKDGIEGISGRFVSQKELNLQDFKVKCEEQGIKMTSFESLISFSEFKVNEDDSCDCATLQNRRSVDDGLYE